MAKFDAEDLCDVVLSVMTTGGALNAAILAVETEKIAAGNGLTPTLAPIPDDNYFYQTWTDRILNKKIGIFYGIEEVKTIDGDGAVAKVYKIFIEIVMVDSGQTKDSARRINRYSRALEDLFNSAYTPKIAGSKINIDQLRPMAFKLALDSDDEVKTGGISILVSLF